MLAVFIKAKTPPLPPDVAVMTASGAEQISSVLSGKGHGIFTYYLLEALGRGNYSLPKIYDYLRPAVENAARKNNVEQCPELLVVGDDKADLTLMPANGGN